MAKLIDFKMVEADAILIDSTSFQSFGYGIISQRVTKCKDISLQAKGVFAYLVSCAGNDKQTYPNQSTICNDLGIKKADTLRKYIKELQAEGFVKIVKTTKKSLFYKNIYLIADDTRSQDVWKKEYSEGKEFEEAEIIENKIAPTLGEVEAKENKNLIDNNIVCENTETMQVVNNTLENNRKIAIENLKEKFGEEAFNNWGEATLEMRIYKELKELNFIE